MTNRFVIALPDDAGKQDELQALFKFAHRMPEGSYLNMLFTEEFLVWVEAQIRADWCPDMYNHWMSNSQDLYSLRATYHKHLEDTDMELSHRNAKIAELQDKLESTQKAADWHSDRADREENDKLNAQMKLHRANIFHHRMMGKVRAAWDRRERHWEFLFAKLTGGK